MLNIVNRILHLFCNADRLSLLFSSLIITTSIIALTPNGNYEEVSIQQACSCTTHALPATTYAWFWWFSQLEGTHRVRTHAVLLFTLTLTLTYDLSTQNHATYRITFIPYTKFGTIHFLSLWTNRVRDRRPDRPTHADRQGRQGQKLFIFAETVFWRFR